MSDAVLRLAQPSARRSAPGILFGALSALCAVLLLATSAWLIVRAAGQPELLAISEAVVGVRAFALGRAVFRYAERVVGHDAALRQLGELRVGIYRRLVPLAPDGTVGLGRGDLLARTVSDVDALPDLPLRVVQPLIVSAVVAVGSVVGVAVLLPAAGAWLAVMLVLAFGIAALVTTALAGSAERALAPLRGRLQELLLELAERLDVLIAFDAVDGRLDAIARADRRLRRATTARAAGAGAVEALVALLAGAATIAGVLVGVPALRDGAINGPALAVLVLIPLAVFEVVGSVPLALGAWRQVRSSAERVASAVPERVPTGIPVDGVLGDEHPDLGGDVPVIELDGLSARWPTAAGHGDVRPGDARRGDTLHGVSLTVRRGERMLVRGATGSGKTTLAHVLVRLLDHRGGYRLGGVDVHRLAQDDVRRIVGLCEQRPYLFDDTIRQNLLFARDTSTDEDLLAVLDRVGLAEWTRERGGLDAPVGERGSLVSGGQAQRIALARALLAGFPVIVFDEPTANVDAARGDALLRDILAPVDADTTVIVISHAPVPGELVTSVVTLDGGRVVADLPAGGR